MEANLYQRKRSTKKRPQESNQEVFNSPSWARTNDTAVNSRVLCQLSYGGIRREVRAECLTSGVGEYLSSRAVSSQVLSARQSLTSVFGMGTGGPSALITPTCSVCVSTVLSISYLLHFVKYQSALVLAPLDSIHSAATRQSCRGGNQLP